MKSELNSNEQLRLRRLEEASQWLLRLQSGERSDEQLNEWLQWIDADPANFAEYERLQRDWKDLDALKGLDPENEFPPTPAQKSVLLEQETAHARRRGRYCGSSIRSTFLPRRKEARWALAACVTAVALALAAIHYSPWRGTGGGGLRQVTAATNRAATLPDGSSMILGTQSRVEVDFNGPKRQLDLSSGEAYFKVKHDRTRPFVVQAGAVNVTAVGTAFDVRRDQDKITVTVEEGTVEVADSSLGQEDLGANRKPTLWRAQAGYQLIYSVHQRTASIASVNPAAELAWRNGELSYVREPLGSVVENLNRYSTRKIIIEDPGIARLPFTGTAFAASADDWLAGVEQAYPVTIKRTAGGDVILSAGQ